MAAQRIRRGAAATLSVLWTDTNDSAVAADGTVTVAVTRADGTVLVAAGTATLNPSTGRYTKALTAAQTATLDELTVTWSDAGSSTSRTTKALIVDGFAFSLADARALPGLDNEANFTDDAVLRTRDEVEGEFERITLRAATPRYALVTVDGTGNTDLRCGLYDVTALRSARTYPYKAAASYTDLTADQIARTAFDADGLIRRTDGVPWPHGFANVRLGVEYGLAEIEPDLRRAMLYRFRTLIMEARGGIPPRAKTWAPADGGGTYEIARATHDSTGLDEVDAVYGRYSRRGRGGESVPYSASFDLDPQRHSLFRGPRR